MAHSIFFWVGFHLLLFILLGLDWYFFHRKKHKISFKWACVLSGFWIGLALLFNLFIYLTLGSEKALQFFTGYLIEKSLSVDNLFLFLLIFMHFRTPAAEQHNILSWGILGAIVFRISLILLGIALIENFHWMFYVFGALLLFSGAKLLFQRTEKDPFKGFFFNFLYKVLPVSTDPAHGQFFIKKAGKWRVTTLFLTLLMIESTDIVFALDSIPAVFAITSDPFIVYTSNIFAILGLRSLYFLLASSLQKMRFIKIGLAAILLFVGAKMVLSDLIHISVPISLGIILAILLVTVLFSLRKKKI